MGKVKFEVDGDTISGSLFSSPKANTSGLLIIHGGGNSNKKRFSKLQENLLDNDISSFSFDFQGIGESTGKLEDSTLESRLKTSQAALNAFRTQSGLKSVFLAGFSMGGHIAAKLAQTNKIAGLVFSSAATYGSDSEDKKFNGEFTKTIRREDSWKTSSIFDYLPTFKGKILVIYGENDDVIPLGVKEQYIRLGREKGRTIVFKSGKHNLFAPTNPQEEAIQKKAIDAISSFMKSEK